MRLADGGHGGGGSEEPVTRLAFDNIHRLPDRFPLLTNERFQIPALIDLLTYRGVTTFFVDLVPPGSAIGRVQFDPNYYMTTFDNVFHLPGGGRRPHADVAGAEVDRQRLRPPPGVGQLPHLTRPRGAGLGPGPAAVTMPGQRTAAAPGRFRTRAHP